MSDLLVDFLLDVMAEGWLPHPFVQHLSERCALCGAGLDRAVHDRGYADRLGLRWGAVLTSLNASTERDSGS